MIIGKIALGAAALPFTLGGLNGAVPALQARAEHTPPPHMAEVFEAIENNDFEAWKTAVTADEKSPFAAHATQEVFERLEKIHEAMTSGDKETARTLSQELDAELGIERPRMNMRMHGGHKGGMKEFHNDISEEDKILLHDAIEAGDYETWKSIMDAVVPDSEQDRLTEKQFTKMVDWMKKKEVKLQNATAM